MRFNFTFFIQCFPELIAKMPFTLWLGLVSFAASFILAVIIAVLRNVKCAPVRWIVSLYISFFRSTPYISSTFFMLMAYSSSDFFTSVYRRSTNRIWLSLMQPITMLVFPISIARIIPASCFSSLLSPADIY